MCDIRLHANHDLYRIIHKQSRHHLCLAAGHACMFITSILWFISIYRGIIALIPPLPLQLLCQAEVAADRQTVGRFICSATSEGDLSYVLALATSIVTEDFSQATRPCLCPSTWVSASTGTLSIFILCRMNLDFGMKLLFVSLQTYCQWISILSMGPATFPLHRPVSPGSIAADQPPAPAAVSIGHEVQPAKTLRSFLLHACKIDQIHRCHV